MNLADVKRPKARLHIQKGRFPQRKRFSATLTQPTLASNTTPEVGYGLVKKKVRMSGGHMSIHRRLEFYRYWTKIIHKIVKNPTVYG